MTESEIKAECERLARKAWPWEADCEDPLSVSIGPDSRVWHPFEEDSCGIRLTHPERAPQALLAALRVLAGEPDPRDAEIAKLQTALAEAMARNACLEEELRIAALHPILRGKDMSPGGVLAHPTEAHVESPAHFTNARTAAPRQTKPSICAGTDQVATSLPAPAPVSADEMAQATHEARQFRAALDKATEGMEG